MHGRVVIDAASTTTVRAHTMSSQSPSSRTPASRSKRSRSPLRRAVHAAVVLLSVTVAGACGGEDTADRVIGANESTTSTAADTNGSTTTAAAQDVTSTTASTLPPLEPGQQELWVFTLELGDCFNERIRSASGDEVETIVKVPCEDAHDNEVYASEEFPGELGGTYPGNSVLTGEADSTCLDAFESFVGTIYVLSELEIATAVPSLESWIDGDRSLACILFDASGEKLVGTMRDSNR